MSRPTNQYSADFMPYLKRGFYALRHGNWIKAYGVFADSIRTLHPNTKEREALDRESNWDSPEDFKALLEWVEAEFNPQDIVPANMARLRWFFQLAMSSIFSQNLSLDFIKVMALAFKAEGQRLLPSQLVVKPMGGGDIAWRKWPNEAERR